MDNNYNCTSLQINYRICKNCKCSILTSESQPSLIIKKKYVYFHPGKTNYFRWTYNPD